MNTATTYFTSGKRKQLFFLIITYFQLFLWLHFFEALTYAKTSRDAATFSVFLSLFVSSILFLWLQFKSLKGPSKTILKCSLALVGLIIVLGLEVKSKEGYAGMGTAECTIKRSILSNAPLPGELEWIYKDIPKDIYIVAEKKEWAKKHRLLAPSYFDYRKIYPSLFSQYRKTLHSTIEEVYTDQQYTDTVLPEFLEFLELGFPGRQLYICYNTAPHIPADSSFAYIQFYGEKIRMKPFFWELLEGSMDDRLKHYYQHLAYYFKSPYYQTKYANDPFFRIWQGNYPQAKEAINQLHGERKHICQQYLNAQLQQEKQQVRKQLLKSEWKQADIQLIYPQVNISNQRDRYVQNTFPEELVRLRVGDSVSIHGRINVNFDTILRILVYDGYHPKDIDWKELPASERYLLKPLDTIVTKVSNDHFSVNYEIPTSNAWNAADRTGNPMDSIENLKIYFKLTNSEVDTVMKEFRYSGNSIEISSGMSNRKRPTEKAMQNHGMQLPNGGTTRYRLE